MNTVKYSYRDFEVYHLNNGKFKNIIISICFLFPLDTLKIAHYRILSNMLSKYNQKYKTEQELSKYLEYNYGMSLKANSIRSGMVNEFTVSIKFLNEKYLQTKENLFEIAINLLYTTIFEPLFEEDIFNHEKKLLIDDIKRSLDDKARYASNKFFSIMYENEKCGKNLFNSIDIVENLTLLDIKNAYFEMINSKKVISVIGKFNNIDLSNCFKLFKFEKTKNEKLEFLDMETRKIDNINEVIEKTNYNQSIVHIGFRTNIRTDDELYVAMFMLDYMMGGYFNSSLVEEIREKRSLAYSVYSSYYPSKGTFTISAGIDKNNFEEFKEIVFKIIKEYQEGIISDENFNATQKILINGQYKAADEIYSGINDVIKVATNRITRTTEENVDRIKNVTKNDIMSVAKCLKLDTIYMLEGK